jgi:alkylated DNA repair dioxygenase AlkB
MSIKIPIKLRASSDQGMSVKIPIKLRESHGLAQQKHVDTDLKVTEATTLAPHEKIPGLYYCKNFLTTEDSKKIHDDFKSNQKWVGVTASQKSRRVIHYGYIYSYTGGPLQKTDAIPDLYSLIVDRFESLVTKVTGESQKFDQLIINEYVPGQGIAAHTDHTSKFGNVIVCLTLGSGVEIEFTRAGHEPVGLYVEPNSLYVMSGDARYLWKHAICHRKTDLVNNVQVPRGVRTSLTFRKSIGVGDTP